MSEIKFLTKEKILFINSAIEKQSKKYAEIEYVRRFVNINIRKRLDKLVECAEEYYYWTKDAQLTSAYYLKNIIILQALEDANHRTAITGTSIFLNDNGYNIKKITRKCSIRFKRRLSMYRFKEYGTTDPLPSRVLNFDDNIINNSEFENNELFEYCLNFVTNKIIN
ncbi:MAG: hypothetical protein FP833_10665 [Atribacteria sp.]|nr:hypothetical protein [Candidatus Atribacteria bacterium]MBU4221709.1 hypothetical protein [Euryarchaeota archaeon]MCG2737496.1 hypothetical protein [Candidatus Methanoperedenaceae archaeon]